VIIILILSLLLVGCSQPVNYTRIKVSKVIDGDTIRLSNGKLLRYIGMDTPEVRIHKNGGWLYDPQPFSLAAKEFNKKLVENKFIKVEFDVKKFGTYGRLLGYCFIGNTFVNAKLVQQGLAVLYTRPPDVKYTDLFIRMQKEARANSRGLWGKLAVIPSTDVGNFINQIRVVSGRVLDTYQSKKVVYLNFGRDYKRDFTVIIFNDCLKLFRDKGIEPVSFYKGKYVQVWGKIRKYHGPEIIAGSPFQIKVLNEN